MLIAPVALLGPRIPTVVISIAFPEARRISNTKLNATQPLRALPRVEVRDHEAQRIAVIGRELRAVRMRREEHVRAQAVLERDIRGEAVLAVRDDEPGIRLGLDEVDDRLERNTFPDLIELRPGGDAVHIRGALRPRQLLELLPVHPQRLLDVAEDAKIPGVRIEPRHGAVVEHRPLLRQRLAGRHAPRDLRWENLVPPEERHGASSGPLSMCARMNPRMRV